MMKKIFPVVVGVIVFVSFGTLSAQAESISVITFDSQPEVYFESPLYDSGYVFSSNYDGFGANNDSSWPSNGTTHLMSWSNEGNYSGFDLTSSIAGVFDVFSFDFAGAYSNGNGPVNSLVVTGWLDGVSVDAASFTAGVDFLNASTYTTLDISFLGIDMLTVTAEGFNNRANFENFVVTAVPLPAAAWLFGSALAGLGWMRRRQTA
jgi:hypothetical protein